MVIVSIDTETTSLDPLTGQILSLGAVIEDTNNLKSFEEIPKFHCIVTHDFVQGTPFALNMNKDIIEKINEYHLSKDHIAMEQKYDCKFTNNENLAEVFRNFLFLNGFTIGRDDKITFNVVGKNYQSFDEKFLEKLPNWSKFLNPRRRVGDPSILFTDWKNDSNFPNLTKCKERAGFTPDVTHDALEDALDVIRILRTQY